MNIEQIREYLPHRYPFLLVDRVEELTLGDGSLRLREGGFLKYLRKPGKCKKKNIYVPMAHTFMSAPHRMHAVLT